MFPQYDYLWLSLGNGRLYLITNFLINYLKYKDSSVEEGADQVSSPLALIMKNPLLWGKQAF